MNFDSLLKATDSDGAPLYSESTVQDFLALVAIVTGEKRLDPVLAKFKVALDGAVPEGAIAERIAQYFERYPLPPRLTTELQRMLRDDVAAAGSVNAKVTGANDEKRPLAGPVEGTLRGGVFARVVLSKRRN